MRLSAQGSSMPKRLELGGLRRQKLPRALRPAATEGKGGITDETSDMSKLRHNKRLHELPKELQDLYIDDRGNLVDTKSGKVINDFGATRFDVAVRALRGELDPPKWIENTERNPGVLMQSLINFPCNYTFQVVGKPTANSTALSISTSSSDSSSESSSDSSNEVSSFVASSNGSSSSTASSSDRSSSSGNARGAVAKYWEDPFLQDVVKVVSKVCQVEVVQDNVKVTERLKGKYISIGVEVRVRAPEIVSRVYEELGRDPRVTMKF